MAMTTAADLVVTTLGPCRLDSPLKSQLESRQTTVHSVGETDRVLFHDTVNLIRESGCDLDSLPSFEPAGPRQKIFFDTAKMRVGIVTCGGLCPGINNVIRGIVMELSFHYGVQRIYGFRNGYQGFVGAMKIAAVVAKRDGKIAVVGIPKTIDNDIPSIDQSFGFQSAFGEATKSIQSAHVEAKASPNGVGLVKLMGRHSGFIACSASLAVPDANSVLIPEVPFALDGPNGLLEHLLTRVRKSGHAVIVAAEGAGQELIANEATGQPRSFQ